MANQLVVRGGEIRLGKDTASASLIRSSAGGKAQAQDGSGDWFYLNSVLPGGSTNSPQKRNFVINGDGRVQQRSGSTLVNNTLVFGADRFLGMASASAVTAGTFAANSAASMGSMGSSHRFNSVTMTGSTAKLWLIHRVEAADAIALKNQKATLSLLVTHGALSDVPHTLHIRKAGASDNFSTVSAIASGTPVSVSPGTVTRLTLEGVSMGDCSTGVEIAVEIACGAVTTRSFEYTDVQLEAGDLVRPFEVSKYDDVLGWCQRFCPRFNAADFYQTNGRTHIGGGHVATNNGVSFILISFPVKTRVPPTGVLFTTPGAFQVGYRNTQATVTALSFSTTYGATSYEACVEATCSGVSAGDAVLLRMNSTTAYLEFTGCELL